MPVRPRHCNGQNARSTCHWPRGAGKASAAARSQETILVRATLTSSGEGWWRSARRVTGVRPGRTRSLLRASFQRGRTPVVHPFAAHRTLVSAHCGALLCALVAVIACRADGREGSRDTFASAARGAGAAAKAAALQMDDFGDTVPSRLA